MEQEFRCIIFFVYLLQPTLQKKITMSKLKRIFLTYLKPHESNGKVYGGRASGYGKPEKILAKRDSGHHMNQQEYLPAELDKYSYNSDAIRGREQIIVDENGGAQSQGGTSGNKINPISKRDKKRQKYLDACKRVFGNSSRK